MPLRAGVDGTGKTGAVPDAHSEPAVRPSAPGLYRRMGPAWIISAVACGPATLASVSMAGASFGFELLWVVILSALLAFVAQYMAAKLGILTGQGIISLVDQKLGGFWGWLLMLDALAATWLASTVLMKALVEITGAMTGLRTPWWSVVYAALLSTLVGFGGYRVLETICKGLVALVVLCFAATVAVVRPNLAALCAGIIPSIPHGLDSALLMAGIMGGAVHITIIAMHSYNVNARGWRKEQLRLAWLDTFFSMFLAFGFYSVAIYLTAAAVLHPNGIKVASALDVAAALKPFLGPHAAAVFLAGIWGAVISTITPTFLAAGYFLGDKLGWPLDVKDTRFKGVVMFGCLLSLAAPFLKGSFLTLLVVMLALGLCGTPLIIAIILVLLNRRDLVHEQTNSLLLNVMGGLALLVTTVLAVRFVLS